MLGKVWLSGYLKEISGYCKVIGEFIGRFWGNGLVGENFFYRECMGRGRWKSKGFFLFKDVDLYFIRY